MRTTIDLPDSLFRQAKAEAAQRGTSLKDLFTGMLRRALDERGRETRRMDKPPISRKGGLKIPSRSNRELAAILEKEEAAKIK